jgi:hypothetical protein
VLHLKEDMNPDPTTEGGIEVMQIVLHLKVVTIDPTIEVLDHTTEVL